MSAPGCPRRSGSRSLNGSLPVNPFGTKLSSSGLRRHLDAPGTVTVEKQLSPDFTLFGKHLASFAALIDVLVREFPVFAIVRNPLAALASWSTLDAPLRRGHIRPAEKLHPDLRQRRAAEAEPLSRQIILMDWFFERATSYLPPGAIITYEAIVATQGQALSAIVPGAAAAAEPLSSRNQNAL